MIRRPPKSTLFPYPTLSRSVRVRGGGASREQPGSRSPRPHWRSAPRRDASRRSMGGGHLKQRSEEHTSELQSRQYLVCRLLLEKKILSAINISSHRSSCHLY